MNIKEIQNRLDRGYTMAIYGTRENIHEQMNNDIKMLLKAINYTRSCDKLNDKILQPFRVFVNANYWEQDNEYICKKTNKKEDLDDIIRYWHQEY